MLAVIPVRDGHLPAGGDETVAECGGRALVVGLGAEQAAEGLAGLATDLVLWEAGDFAPARWSDVLGPVLADEPVVVLPASPDGRDLAPRLAFVLGRPLLAGAVRVTGTGAEVTHYGGLVIDDVRAPGPFVATLLPGVRGVAPHERPGPVGPDAVRHRIGAESVSESANGPVDAEILEILPPDVATMDLTEASRILAGGAGLDGPERFGQLRRIGAALGASVGGTRVVTDRHWLAHQRQIGTTGVVVHPDLYLAFGISGAVQHTSGLGDPRHIISVNTDPFCPMMQLADLAVVSDANAVLDALAARLDIGEPTSEPTADPTGAVDHG
jgi:electron transfer flavoprotein alpha subunit